MKTIRKSILLSIILILTITSFPVYAKNKTTFIGDIYCVRTKYGDVYTSKYYTDKNRKNDFFEESLYYENPFYDVLAKNEKNTFVSCLNEKVATVTKIYEGNPTIVPRYYYYLNLHKSGSTTLLVQRIKKRNMTTKTVQVHYAKYKNPCKSFKIGKKEYASKFNDEPIASLNMKKKSKSGKISIKAKKDWKLKGIYYLTYKKTKNPEEPYDCNYRAKIKNNTKVKINGYRLDYFEDTKNRAIIATFQNKKTGFVSNIILYGGEYKEIHQTYLSDVDILF